MKKLLVIMALVLCTLVFCSCANNSPNDIGDGGDIMFNEIGRKTFSFDSDWKFLKMTQKGGLSKLEIEKSDFDDSAWENVSLAETPKGEPQLCKAEPIKTIREIYPIAKTIADALNRHFESDIAKEYAPELKIKKSGFNRFSKSHSMTLFGTGIIPSHKIVSQ